MMKVPAVNFEPQMLICLATAEKPVIRDSSYQIIYSLPIILYKPTIITVFFAQYNNMIRLFEQIKFCI